MLEEKVEEIFVSCVLGLTDEIGVLRGKVVNLKTELKNVIDELTTKKFYSAQPTHIWNKNLDLQVEPVEFCELSKYAIEQT